MGDAMQTRCVNCKAEQYGPAVAAISKGKAKCPMCRHQGERMSNKEYRQAMKGTKR